MAAEKGFKIVSNIIEECEDIPGIFSDGFKYTCMSLNKLPYTVHVAKYDEEGTEITSRLISLTDDGIFFFERINSQARLTQYNYDEIIYLKRLDSINTSMLEICGTSNGRLYESKLEYDINDRKIFDSVILSIRLKEKLPEGFAEEQEENISDDSYELLKLAYFKDSHPKLYGYAVESLLPEQKIRKTLFQNTVFKKTLKVLKTRLARDHIMILAGSELIIISEGRSKKRAAEFNAGGYWYYVPVSKIVSMDIKSEDEYYLTLTIVMKERETIELYFDNYHKAQLEQLVKSTLNVYNEIKENEE
ncbi:MAG: hypothetical protein AB9844_02830 [Clostridiaceae bacterium]